MRDQRQRVTHAREVVIDALRDQRTAQADARVGEILASEPAGTQNAAVERTGVDGLTAAVIIGQRARALARAGIPVQRLGPAEWVDVFDLYASGRIPREAVPAVAARMATAGVRAAEAAAAEGIALLPRDAWQAQLGTLSMAGYLASRDDGAARRLRFLAGRAMAQLRGRAPAKDVAAWLAGRIEEMAP